MKLPVALSWDEQLALFKSRGMTVTDNDIDKIKNISYYRLKEFARPLSTVSKNNDEISISYIIGCFIPKYPDIIDSLIPSILT